MMRWICFLMFFNIQVGLAQEFRRQVNLEWEIIEGASSYDIEVTSAKSKKPFTQKVKTTEWQGQLTPGKYSMRLRARDFRGVPGEWSAENPFVVGLDPVTLAKPAVDEKIQSQDASEEEVKFSWQPTRGAKHYIFEVHAEGTSFKETKETSATSINVEIPVATKFTWSVKAVFNEDIQSEKDETRSFTVMGKKIEKPKIEKIENEFVRKIKWERPVSAESFDLDLHRFDEKTKKWTKFKSFENVKENEISFDPTWEGGQYRMVVKAKNPNRANSDTSVIKFPVQKGDRSPAAEYVATVRRSIDRVNDFYGIASYMISEVSYKSSMGLGFNGALAGTGRLGLGYLKKESSWGYQGILDYSGISFSKGTQTYASMEFSAIYRQAPSDLSEIRYNMGIFQKENPVLLPTDTLSNTDYVADKFGVAGPFGTAEYWYSLSPKFGFQLNTGVHLNAIEVSPPAYSKFKPSMSYHLGALGSYRVNSRFTGLLGLTYKQDTLNFTYSSPYASVSSFDTETSVNGLYISLFAEYDF